MSLFEVDVLAEVDVSAAQKEMVRRAADAALADQMQAPGAACTILLSDDARIRELNRLYLGQDKSTDVLSFPSGEPTPTAESYLGDIMISVPAAERQALAGGHSLDGELQLLTVHAVLHLLGYDHATEREKREMWNAQSRILTNLGSDISEPTAEYL